MTNKVWIVWGGPDMCGSEPIEGVFMTEEGAEKYREVELLGDGYVEEHELKTYPLHS